MRGGQLKRELGDGVGAGKRVWKMGDSGGRGIKHSFGRKFTLYGERWETVEWEMGESIPLSTSCDRVYYSVQVLVSVGLLMRSYYTKRSIFSTSVFVRCRIFSLRFCFYFIYLFVEFINKANQWTGMQMGSGHASPR